MCVVFQQGAGLINHRLTAGDAFRDGEAMIPGGPFTFPQCLFSGLNQGRQQFSRNGHLAVFAHLLAVHVPNTEEFAIYLNYVRKLGFEETPDYDFLRELFTKVLKNRGEVEDGVYDWMTINGGKGWEAGVSLNTLSSVQDPSRILLASET